MAPLNPDDYDLACDTCPETFQGTSDTYRTFERARVHGWHIYQHVQMKMNTRTGEALNLVDTRILCPKCIGTPRTRLEPAPLVLEGQADILEDLNIDVKPVEKEQRGRREHS